MVLVSVVFRGTHYSNFYEKPIRGRRTYDFPIGSYNIPIDHNEAQFKAHCKLNEEFKTENYDCQIIECWP